MLADGTFFEGAGFGAAGSGGGRGLLQHRDDRLSGDPDRSVLCRADRGLHLSRISASSAPMTKTSRRSTPAVRGLIVRADAEHPSNYRSLAALDRWLKRAQHSRRSPASTPARSTSAHPRERHAAWRDRQCGDGELDRDALLKQAQGFPGPGRPRPRQGGDRAPDATNGARRRGPGATAMATKEAPTFRAVVIDYGVKRNILRLLAGMGADITVRAGQRRRSTR